MRGLGFLVALHAIREIAKYALTPLYLLGFVLYVGLSQHLVRIGITTSLDQLKPRPPDASGSYWITYVSNHPLHGSLFLEDANRMKFLGRKKNLIFHCVKTYNSVAPRSRTNRGGHE